MPAPRPRHLVFGAGGQLGFELSRALAGEGGVIALGRPEVDFLRPETAVAALERHRPAVVWNAAAATAVDALEADPALAMRVNAEAPGIIAGAAARLGAVLVHFSTDYVFDGTRSGPYTEDDVPNPLNVYGASKLAGEAAVRSAGGRCLILRTSWVYSARGRNFLRTVARLGQQPEPLRVVDDQIGAPTEASQLAAACVAVAAALEGPGVALPAAGLFHVAAAGATSWYGFACAIRDAFQARGAGWAAPVVPIRSADRPSAARRPANSRLSIERFVAVFGVQPVGWRAGLDLLLGQYASPTAILEDRTI